MVLPNSTVLNRRSSSFRHTETAVNHAFLDSVVMLAELTVKLDKREQFLDYTVEHLRVSRSCPGNLAFDILIDETRPEKIRFYEVWQSDEAQQAYMARRVQAGDLTNLLSFLAEPPKFTRLRSITDHRADM